MVAGALAQAHPWSGGGASPPGFRTGGLFDGMADFDKTTFDPQTGGIKAEMIPESTTGGPGDKLHPRGLPRDAASI